MNQTADIRDLLAHAEWLRRLAGQLVGRAGDPEDLVQQTWMAAVRRPPAAERPARPWLAEVLRNFARRSHRDGQARARRERTAVEVDATPPAPPADALLEAAQVQRRLADLVLALDEPYRTTVLLRFYQGLEPAEIARDAGIPAGTVRWRVNEAIRRLRASLDTRSDTRDWRRVLLPLAELGTPASTATKGGLLIMSTKGKLAASGLLVAAMAVGVGVRVDHLDATADASRTLDSASVPRAGSLAATGAAGTGSAATAHHSTASERQPPSNLTDTRSRSSRPAPPRLVAVPPAGAPAPDPAAAEATGTLEADQIRLAMRRTMPAIKDCYAKLLQDHPKSAGRLQFHFTVVEDGNGGGRISDASIEPQAASDTGTPELIAPLAEQCMLNAIAAAPFPAPQGGPVVVSYPFSFSPSEDHPPAP